MAWPTRLLIALLTTGWIIPLTFAFRFFVEAEALIGHSVTPYIDRYDRCMLARDLFTIAFAWLGVSLAAWVFVWTRRCTNASGEMAS